MKYKATFLPSIVLKKPYNLPLYTVTFDLNDGELLGSIKQAATDYARLEIDLNQYKPDPLIEAVPLNHYSRFEAYDESTKE